jgi:ATP-dependent helicase/nuclease subunit B
MIKLRKEKEDVSARFCVTAVETPKKVSASEVENFYRCPFRYFCSTVLKLKPEKKSDDFQNHFVGQLLHDVLKDLFSRFFEFGSFQEALKFGPAAKKELLNLFQDFRLFRTEIYAIYEKSFEQNISTEQTNAGWTEYVKQELKELVFNAASKVLFELKESSFVPFVVSRQINSPFRLAGADFIFSAFADRLDFWMAGQTVFVRSVEYSYSKRPFSVKNFINGVSINGFAALLMSLQLIRREGFVARPAGVCVFSLLNKWRNMAGGKEGKVGSLLSGIFTNDIDVLRAIEPELSGEIIPITIKKDGTLKKHASLLSDEQFCDLKTRLNALITEFLEDLSAGDFMPSPCNTFFEVCEHCEFHEICHFKLG